jgi:alkanesulfonate monooxygenase SsuD/methylene tetrahydromethanopterin reductase-like flavin-dependent oxidoreductase (luciferase family)
VVPTLSDAAASVGRDAPRVVALVPVHVTDDVTAARARAKKTLGGYGALPSYRAMLDREGLAGPEEAVLTGSEDAVRDGLEAYRTAGVTDIGVAIAADPADRDRTREFLERVIVESRG